MEGKCEHCGKAFIKRSAPQKFCCKKCYAAYQREGGVKVAGKPKKKTWTPAGTEKDIVRICGEAKKLGLSYGQYVVRYGGDANVRGQKVSAASQTV